MSLPLQSSKVGLFLMYDPLFSYPKQYPVKDKGEKREWLLEKSHTQLCFPFSVVFDSFNSEIVECANGYLEVGQCSPLQFAQAMNCKNIPY